MERTQRPKAAEKLPSHGKMLFEDGDDGRKTHTPRVFCSRCLGVHKILQHMQTFSLINVSEY